MGEPAKIERASMDGTSRETLHSTNLQSPNCITIDFQSQTIFWIDAKLDTIESSFVNGSNRRLVTRTFLYHPFSIAIYKGALLWSDRTLNLVLYAPAMTRRTVVGLVPRLPKNPLEVKVVAMDAQPIGETFS